MRDVNSTLTVSEWHPLAKYVKYIVNLYNDYKYKGYVDFRRENVTFSEKLEMITSLLSPHSEIAEIFKWLDIIQYKNFVLFKYKHFDFVESEIGPGESLWDKYDGLFLECRSVVFNSENGDLVLAAMPKFFNMNERKGWTQEELEKMIVGPEYEFYITDKMDGSYCQFTCYRDEIFGSTSKAMDPDNKDAWRLRRAYQLLTPEMKKMIMENRGLTFSFEFCSPDNQIIVYYPKEKEGLYLFNARGNITGRQLSMFELKKMANKYGVQTVEWYTDLTLNNCIDKLDDYKSDEKEGWVISLFNTQTRKVFRAKLKVNDYVLMHRALTKITSPNAIITAVATERWDDFKSKIPSAYLSSAENIANKVIKFYNCVKDASCYYYDLANDKANKTCAENKNMNHRKAFALFVNKEVPKILRGYVFNLYLNPGEDRLPNFVITKSGHQKKLNEIIDEHNTVWEKMFNIWQEQNRKEKIQSMNFN